MIGFDIIQLDTAAQRVPGVGVVPGDQHLVNVDLAKVSLLGDVDRQVCRVDR